MVGSAVLATVQVASDFAVSAAGHASAAHGRLESLVAAVTAAIVFLVFVLCARYFLEPGETSPGHIKRRILE